MNPDELRQRIVESIDNALANPLLLRFASAETIHQLKAERQYWMNADGTALLTLLAAYNATV